MSRFLSQVVVDANGEPLAGAVGEIYALTDALNANPLPIFDSTGAAIPLDQLIANNDGVTPQFSTPGNPVVKWVSGSHTVGMIAFDLIPQAGASGQVLTKMSLADYDLSWTDPVQGIPPGGLDGQALIKDGLADYQARWANVGASMSGLGYSVMDEGAVGDAMDLDGTDDTEAWQKAMDKAGDAVAFGGTMIIPPLPNGRAYHIKGTVEPRSGVRVLAYGAMARKYSHSVNYSVFSARSATRRGYGASVRNFRVEGLTFRGSFTTGKLTGCGVTLHHSDQVSFYKCRWVEAIITGHAIDSMGTRGLVVDDCDFEGFLPQMDREYTEAVQLDFSKISSVIDDAPESYDGLGTINATIRNSRFTQLTIGTTTYPAPNPTGSHTRVEGRWNENILFENNLVEGCHAPVSTDAFALVCKGWLHFFYTRGVKSRNNRFINVGNRQARVFGAHAITTGTRLVDVGVTDAPSAAMTPMPMQNFTSEGDTFIGFANDELEALIRITGTDTTPARDIKVIRPIVRDSWSTPGISANKGTELLDLRDMVGVQVDGVNVTDARSLGYFNNVSKMNVNGGLLKNLGAYIGRFVTCVDVTIDSVHVDGHGGGWYFHTTCKGIEIDGGSIVNGRVDAILTRHFTFSSTTEFSVHDVRVPKDDNGYTAVIDAIAESNGKFKDNILTGWDLATVVNKGPTSTVETTSASSAPAITWETVPARTLGMVRYVTANAAYESRPTTRTDVSFRWYGPIEPTTTMGFIDGADFWENLTA